MNANNNIIRIGIDPGLTGFISIWRSETNNFQFHRIPLIKKKCDYLQLNKIFADIDKKSSIFAVVEDVHSIQGSSAKSNFSFGGIVHVIDCILTINNIPFAKIQPKQWQKQMWNGIDTKKKKSKGGKLINDTKETSKFAAKILFPKIDLRKTVKCSTVDHNKIDSLLICEYCKKNY